MRLAPTQRRVDDLPGTIVGGTCREYGKGLDSVVGEPGHFAGEARFAETWVHGVNDDGVGDVFVLDWVDEGCEFDEGVELD